MLNIMYGIIVTPTWQIWQETCLHQLIFVYFYPFGRKRRHFSTDWNIILHEMANLSIKIIGRFHLAVSNLFLQSYLWINPNQLTTLIARVGKHRLVTPNAVRMVISQNIPLPCERLVTLPATEMGRVPILVHCLCILSTKNQLSITKKHNKHLIKIVQYGGSGTILSAQAINLHKHTC